MSTASGKTEQQVAYDILVEAAREFVAKVESGKARSVNTYAKLKGALLLLDEPDADDRE